MIEKTLIKRIMKPLYCLPLFAFTLFWLVFPQFSLSEDAQPTSGEQPVQLAFDSNIWRTEDEQQQILDILRDFGVPHKADFVANFDGAQDVFITLPQMLATANQNGKTSSYEPFLANRVVRQLGKGAWSPVICVNPNAAANDGNSAKEFDFGKAVQHSTAATLTAAAYVDTTPCQDVARGKIDWAVSYSFDGDLQSVKGADLKIVGFENELPMAAVASKPANPTSARGFVKWWSTSAILMTSLVMSSQFESQEGSK